MTDIIVAGGGPAGLTAALYAVRAGRSVLVLEEAAPGGQINFSPLVENYPGLPASAASSSLRPSPARRRSRGGAGLCPGAGLPPGGGGLCRGDRRRPPPLPRPDPRPWPPGTALWAWRGRRPSPDRGYPTAPCVTAPSIRAGTPPSWGRGHRPAGGPVPFRRVPPGDPDPPPAGVPGQSKAGGAGTDPGQYPPAAGLYTAGPAPGGGQAHRSEGPPGLHRTDPGAPPGRGVRRRGAVPAPPPSGLSWSWTRRAISAPVRTAAPASPASLWPGTAGPRRCASLPPLWATARWPAWPPPGS